MLSHNENKKAKVAGFPVLALIAWRWQWNSILSRTSVPLDLGKFSTTSTFQ